VVVVVLAFAVFLTVEPELFFDVEPLVLLLVVGFVPVVCLAVVVRFGVVRFGVVVVRVVVVRSGVVRVVVVRSGVVRVVVVRVVVGVVVVVVVVAGVVVVVVVEGVVVVDVSVVSSSGLRTDATDAVTAASFGLATDATDAVTAASFGLATDATDAVVADAAEALSDAAEALLEEEPPDEPEDEPPEVELLEEVPSSSAVSWSSAAVRLVCASSSVSSAAEGFSDAISCPFLTCCPTVTSTLCSVPLVAKLTAWSTPGSTLPLPETVVWTTPLAAVTVSFEVRAELVGVPSSVMPMAITASATPASRMMYHGRTDRRLRF
jgi:hypothetical protein